jgi:hypothetical protein
MGWYRVCIVLHFLAAFLWLGHMFVWSLFAMPALKRIEPAATAELLRERSLYLGGLGWPALVVLIPTGIYMLAARGIAPADVLSGAAFAMPGGKALALKLVLVGCMVAYQAIVAHRPARMAIHFNIAVALVLLAASVVIARGGA